MMDFEVYLKDTLAKQTPSRINEAMAYSLLAGGKRLRPQLLFACLEAYGQPVEVGYPFACALEMIHTYSLIHDDLPAMDNDDLRRGRKTCHIEYDEATAILAGDGLLTAAFELMANSNVEASQALQCIQVLASCAGVEGMILGQCLDIQAETKDISWDELKQLHINKTGKLFAAPFMMAAILAGASNHLDSWQRVGEQLGLAFQIQDDILDVTMSATELGKSNSDVTNNKQTSITCLGLENAKTMCDDLFHDTKKSIHELPIQCESMIQLIESIEQRKK